MNGRSTLHLARYDLISRLARVFDSETIIAGFERSAGSLSKRAAGETDRSSSRETIMLTRKLSILLCNALLPPIKFDALGNERGVRTIYEK